MDEVAQGTFISLIHNQMHRSVASILGIWNAHKEPPEAVGWFEASSSPQKGGFLV
jgi:hypothetical protein